MALVVPGLLVVDGVDVGDLEGPGVVRLDLRVQPLLHLGRVHLHPLGGGRGGGDARAAAAAARAFRLKVQATRTPSPCRERRRKPRQDSGTRVCRSSRTAGGVDKAGDRGGTGGSRGEEAAVTWRRAREAWGSGAVGAERGGEGVGEAADDHLTAADRRGGVVGTWYGRVVET